MYYLGVLQATILKPIVKFERKNFKPKQWILAQGSFLMNVQGVLFLRICNRCIKYAFYINFFLFVNDIMEIYNFSVSKMNIFQCYLHFFNIPQTLSISYFFLVLSEFHYAKILIESIVWILLSLPLLKLILLILIFGKSYFSLLNCCCKFLRFFDSIKNCSYV